MISSCQPNKTTPALVVWWVNEALVGKSIHRENFPLWNYDPTGNVYTEVTPGLAAGRATVTAGPDTLFSIMGTPALQGASDGSIQATSFSEVTKPRIFAMLQFQIGGRPIASLSTAGLNVLGITEGAPSAGNVFQLFANGTLAGTMSNQGLIATEIEEV